MTARTFGRKGSDNSELARRREAFIAAERARSAQLAQGDGGPFDRASGCDAQPQANRPILVAEKSVGVAYLLWFFLGIIAAHRFYLGYGASALGQVCLWLVSWAMVLGGQLYAVLGLVVVVIWMVADAFLIPGLCRRANEEARQRAQQYSFA